MDRHMEIGRSSGVTEGTVTDCDACGEGSLVVERRNGRVINEICTNLTCDRHPVAFNVKRIYGLIDEWLMDKDDEDFRLVHHMNAGKILSLASHLFENLKL